MKVKTAEEIIRRYKRGDKDFKGVTIKDGDFSKLRLVGIVFEGATLVNCNFEKSILQRAYFSAANLRGANLRGANLAKADLKGVDFRGAIMRAVDLSGADLRWANLEGVDLAGSIIASANFDGANLKNASLQSTDPGKWWWKANLDEAKLDNTVLPDGTVFSQQATETGPEEAPLEEPGPAQPTPAAGPNYEKADRLYYEALGIVASIQVQMESGVPANHPRIQSLMREATDKFGDALEISDESWSHFTACRKYVADLMVSTADNPPRDTQFT